jgi:hypothetical protein
VAVNCSSRDLPDTLVLVEIYRQSADVSYDGDVNSGSRNFSVPAMKTLTRKSRQVVKHRRSGLSSLDYMLVLGIILPLAAFVIPNGKRMIQLVYEMMTVLVSWPFM